MVAGDHHQDPAGAGNRHAQPAAHCVPGGFGRREPATVRTASFPGQYGAARIFYYNSLMRRKLKIPQIAAVMGPCIAGGAYLPALSDVIIMVRRPASWDWAGRIW